MQSLCAWVTPTPSRLYDGTQESASYWTIMQSLCVETLHHTIALSGQTWKVAVDQLTNNAEDNAQDMRVLVCN